MYLWRKTLQLRREHLSLPQCDVKTYVDLFPAIKSVTEGPKLVDIDFEQQFPGRGQSLLIEQLRTLTEFVHRTTSAIPRKAQEVAKLLEHYEEIKGSAVAMIGANLRYGSGAAGNMSLNGSRVFQCHPGGETEALVIFTLGSLGIAANIALMGLILANKHLRRWSQGLLFHQAMVDCCRAAILIPLGLSILRCEPVKKCSLVETAFLLLVTVSTVNMLTTVLNDSPVFPEDEEEDKDLMAPLLMDSPQCVLFGTFMIWFASITINLGPTFLSGALAANSEGIHNAPSCPLVHGPFRHYVLNVLWIIINVICVLLTLFHLHKLHRDLTKANVEAVRVAGLVTTLVSVTGGGGFGAPHSNPSGDPNAPSRTGAVEEHRRMRNYILRVEREGVQRVKMFLVITAAYVIFWGPLFFVTLVHHPLIGNPLGYEITLHVAYVHAFVNPSLFLVLHKGLRTAALELCCGCCVFIGAWVTALSSPPPPTNFPPPPAPPLYKHNAGDENLMYVEEGWKASGGGRTPTHEALPTQNGSGPIARFSPSSPLPSSSSSD